jgi:hypothetical protein
MEGNKMNGVIVMLINYFHDLAVALLAINILSVYIVGRTLDESPLRDEILPRLFRVMSRVTYGALAFVLAGGVVRAFNFMEFEWNQAAGQGQIPALVVKHALLVGLTVFGLITHRKYQRKYGGSN